MPCRSCGGGPISTMRLLCPLSEPARRAMAAWANDMTDNGDTGWTDWSAQLQDVRRRGAVLPVLNRQRWRRAQYDRGNQLRGRGFSCARKETI